MVTYRLIVVAATYRPCRPVKAVVCVNINKEIHDRRRPFGVTQYVHRDCFELVSTNRPELYEFVHIFLRAGMFLLRMGVKRSIAAGLVLYTAKEWFAHHDPDQ